MRLHSATAQPGDDLARFMSRTPVVPPETAVWVPGKLEFLVSTYVTELPPPSPFVTSARCIVLRDNSVLVVTDRDGSRHIIPGGRREQGETLTETVQRELREETALTVAHLRQIGVLGYRHQTPRPAGYAYPFPVFLQVVFTGMCVGESDPICDDEWAVSAKFEPLEVTREVLPAGQSALLDAASGNDSSCPRR